MYLVSHLNPSLLSDPFYMRKGSKILTKESAVKRKNGSKTNKLALPLSKTQIANGLKPIAAGIKYLLQLGRKPQRKRQRLDGDVKGNLPLPLNHNPNSNVKHNSEEPSSVSV
jgi:hypothetical protein